MLSTIDTKHNAYKLKSGRFASSINIEDLQPEEIKELLDMPVSAWEQLMMRKNIHTLTDAIAAHFGQTELMFDEIKRSLMVRIKNGEEKEVPIAQVVAEIYAQHSGLRKRDRLFKAISENKILILFVMLSALICFSMITKIDWLLPLIIPIVVLIIKLLVK